MVKSNKSYNFWVQINNSAFMRNLDLTEMENIEGGGCAGDAGMAAFAIIAFGIAVFAGGPLGLAAGWSLWGAGLASARLVANGYCF